MCDAMRWERQLEWEQRTEGEVYDYLYKILVSIYDLITETPWAILFKFGQNSGITIRKLKVESTALHSFIVKSGMFILSFPLFSYATSDNWALIKNTFAFCCECTEGYSGFFSHYSLFIVLWKFSFLAEIVFHQSKVNKEKLKDRCCLLGSITPNIPHKSIMCIRIALQTDFKKELINKVVIKDL